MYVNNCFFGLGAFRMLYSEATIIKEY
jgi:hypothetical protein